MHTSTAIKPHRLTDANMSLAMRCFLRHEQHRHLPPQKSSTPTPVLPPPQYSGVLLTLAFWCSWPSSVVVQSSAPKLFLRLSRKTFPASRSWGGRHIGAKAMVSRSAAHSRMANLPNDIHGAHQNMVRCRGPLYSTLPSATNIVRERSRRLQNPAPQ